MVISDWSLRTMVLVIGTMVVSNWPLGKMVVSNWSLGTMEISDWL